MNTQSGKSIWKILSAIMFGVSIIAMGFGFDRMLNYDNGEYYPYEYHNVYVGGDAYNYIINGNHATGFFVLATMFALMGVGFVALYYLSKLVDRQSELVEKQTRDINDAFIKYFDSKKWLDSSASIEQGTQAVKLSQIAETSSFSQFNANNPMT